MLLRAWIGANDAAIASLMPLQRLALRRGLARGADALAEAGDDDLEAAVRERVAFEEPLAVDDQPGVGLARDLVRLPVEADPGRGHDVGVDVVEEVGGIDVLHLQVELAPELAADELGVLGEEENPFAGGEGEGRGRHGEIVLVGSEDGGRLRRPGDHDGPVRIA